MTPVVIDASAGAEIVTNTARGRALLRLLPTDTEGWVPQHFYTEVLGVLRHQSIFAKILTEEQAAAALGRLRRWHLRQAAIPPLLEAAWELRPNMRAADAMYVALAAELEAFLLSDDHRLLNAQTFHRRSACFACHSAEHRVPARSSSPAGIAPVEKPVGSHLCCVTVVRRKGWDTALLHRWRLSRLGRSV